jgi:hypothetical protein
MPHYHILWSEKAELDWERHDSRAKAEASAKLLVRRGETYAIEEFEESCPRCRAIKGKPAHGEKSEPAEKLKYTWQQAVRDAFLEARPDFVSGKVNLAQRAIAARLCEETPTENDNEERIAIREALNSLRALLPERSQATSEAHNKDKEDLA